MSDTTPDTAALRARCKVAAGHTVALNVAHRILLDPSIVRALCDGYDDAQRLRAVVASVEALRPVRHVCSDGVWLRYQDVIAALTAAQGAPAPPAVIDAAHLAHQRQWSRDTFGPGDRLLGVLDHIRKELAEIEADPTDLGEWVDVVILAFDGAWRAGWEPQQVIDAIKAKQARNEARTWPDWRTASPDKAIEHDRSQDAPAPTPQTTTED